MAEPCGGFWLSPTPGCKHIVHVHTFFNSLETFVSSPSPALIYVSLFLGSDLIEEIFLPNLSIYLYKYIDIITVKKSVTTIYELVNYCDIDWTYSRNNVPGSR